jgi:hypothetical protein
LTLVSATVGNFFNLFSGFLHNFLDFAQIYKQEAATGLVGKEFVFVSAIAESFAMQDFCLTTFFQEEVAITIRIIGKSE